MMRNFVVLGCAGLLAFGLSMSSFAGGGTDTDGDGFIDTEDNCTLAPNGPNGSTGSCVDQEDGDADGYGNPCDSDFNNDGATGPDDLSAMVDEVIAVGTDPNFDLNCDGASGPDDLSATVDDVIAVQQPGPSGLACAGSVPCP
jgi:hypothetical protein